MNAPGQKPVSTNCSGTSPVPRPTNNQTKELHDPVELTQRLIRCESVTPAQGDVFDVFQSVLEGLGFSCQRLPFSEDGTPDVDNLYARLGIEGPHFCFAGHLDVVPVGNRQNWSVDPFDAVIDHGQLIGRGACDMKGAVAAFVSAFELFSKDLDELPGSISFLITGDEEGPAINGTVKMLEWLKTNDQVPDHCLVGEPTNQQKLGDTIKMGRRGSLNGHLIVHGAQGHVAYPNRADNPIPRLLQMLGRITSASLDDGTDFFEPSNLEVVTIDTGNKASNVIPAEVSAGFNIRFNNAHSEKSLIEWLRGEFDEVCQEMGGTYDLNAKASGEAFVTDPCAFTDTIVNAITSVCGQKPELSTGGGTSDARYITKYCPVVDFGLVGQSMHKADEHVALSDLTHLRDIYHRVLVGYFKTNGV